MRLLTLGSIGKNLALLIVLAVFPALAILFYSGLEQRQQSIENAKGDVMLLTHTMAEAQNQIARSTREILSTLSSLPAIQDMDVKASAEILKAVLEKNPQYNNMALVDLSGQVLAAGGAFSRINLADRKHVREAIDRRRFAVGEYIVSRVGTSVPAFAFAYPVLDPNGTLKAVLTTAVKLSSFASFYNFSTLPEKSFVGLTDHQGIRLFYYPQREKTNPIGAPIRSQNWQMVIKAKDSGIFVNTGSDGLRRIFAYEQVRVEPGEPPYLCIWAGIPEAYVIAPANAILTRNLLLMLLATVLSLFVSWVVGKNTLISPLQSLVTLTRKIAQGNLSARSEITPQTRELETLTSAFHEMADALNLSQRVLLESEARFRLLMDSLDTFVFVADMESYEVLFVNEYTKKHLGDVVGKKCWQAIQQGQGGPCSFCTNKYLLTEEGQPGEPYSWELQNTVTGKWLYMHDRAIQWIDGRIVRLQVAADITDRIKIEDERERLIAQLKEALAEIKTLSGFLPICASCKMIRDDKGYWNQLETYIRDHSEADFSHGICPDCAKRLYPDLYR